VNESFFGDSEGATSTPKGESFDESFINTTEDKNTQDGDEIQKLEKKYSRLNMLTLTLTSCHFSCVPYIHIPSVKFKHES